MEGDTYNKALLDDLEQQQQQPDSSTAAAAAAAGVPLAHTLVAAADGTVVVQLTLAAILAALSGASTASGYGGAPAYQRMGALCAWEHCALPTSARLMDCWACCSLQAPQSWGLQPAARSLLQPPRPLYTAPLVPACPMQPPPPLPPIPSCDLCCCTPAFPFPLLCTMQARPRVRPACAHQGRWGPTRGALPSASRIWSSCAL